MQDAKDEIRERLNIEDIVGEYLELKRAGRNFKALSPFTNEKTPSFIVSPDKKIWHDFSSGKGGDIFTFVMEMEGFGFREALQHLARKAGIELKQYNSVSSQKLAKRKARELEMYRLATTFFQISLTKNRHAMDYAKTRNLSKDTLRTFKIGYSPDKKDALVQALKKKGFSQAELAQAGLTNRFGGDLFRGRLMIPLMDQTGQTLGFTGRALTPEATPKYLNTPATLLYDKSRHVFALSQAKDSIRKNNQAVIVEGNMDAIASHQAKVSQVVAAAGTALTADHLKIISRFTSDVRLAFDGDRAGVSAAERSIVLAQSVGVDIKIISMPAGFKDPDELIQTSVVKWQQAIASAEPAVDWLIKIYQQQFDLETAQGKRDFGRKIMVVITKLQDPVERAAYLQKVAALLGVSESALSSQTAAASPSKRLKMTKAVLVDPDQLLYQDDLLALGLKSAQVRTLLSAANIIFLQGTERQILARILQEVGAQAIKPNQLKKQAVFVKILTLRAEERYTSYTQDELVKEAGRLLNQARNDYQKHLTEKLRQAEEAGADDLASELRQNINQLIKESRES